MEELELPERCKRCPVLPVCLLFGPEIGVPLKVALMKAERKRFEERLRQLVSQN